MQGRESEKKSSHQQFRMVMRNSREEQLQDKFRALPRVYCIHTIYRFESQEVRKLGV